MSAEAAAAASTEQSPAPRAGSVRVGLIVGPTGTGKSAVALEVAERLGAEIVNADSRQFYYGMDIGTAKPTADERRRVAHHLFDIRSPRRPLDVAEFRSLAVAATADIAARGRRVLVVGGSGFYLRVLSGGIFAGPPASIEIRRELEAIAAARGIAHLHAMLAGFDPEAARRIGPRDLYRIARAIEVFRITGVTISEHQRRHRFARREYETLTVGIAIERARLYRALDNRFDAMVAGGLVGEVRALLEAGHDPKRPPLAAVGYRQIAAALRGETDLAAAITLAKRDTRRLAKRQLTWFRADPELVWVDAEHAAEQAFALFARFFDRTDSAQSEN